MTISTAITLHAIASLEGTTFPAACSGLVPETYLGEGVSLASHPEAPGRTFAVINGEAALVD